ncbi:MAG TPA: copper resistance CopC family protein, partial [Actinomycetota bacterium]
MGSATSCRAVLAAGLAALALAAEADAHIGLRQSEPAAGAALGAGPTAVRLTFSEPAEASLASVEVVGEGGGLFQAGVPVVAPDDPYAIAVRLRELPRGVYTVTWRVVSSVDGHATGGAFSFGVGAVPPAGGAASVDAPRPSALELLGRWAFLAGLVLLVGASVATAAGFGGRRADPRLAGGGWALAVAGLGLVAAGQLRIAEVGVGEFLETDVGGALLERGAALAAAGAALAAFRQTQRFAASVAAVAGLA